MIKEHSYGVIPVFKNQDGTVVYGVVRHAAGHWGFPKGHAGDGETEVETAKRELQEELGIATVTLIPGIKLSEQFAYEREGTMYDKTVTYFVGLVTETPLAPLPGFEAEVTEIRWLPYGEMRALLTYENNKQTLDAADAAVRRILLV